MLGMYPTLLVEHQGPKLVGYPHVSYLNACLTYGTAMNNTSRQSSWILDLYGYGHQTMLVTLKDIMLDVCISPIIDHVRELA